MTLRLRPLRLDDEHEARAAHAELAAEGFPFLLHWEAGEPWVSYLDQLDKIRRGVDLHPDYVPATFLAAVVDGALVGRVSIRHELNAFLTEEGGHIGYAVRPNYRRRGYATEILGQALIIARAAGVARVLVTCDEYNAASAVVIERHGGVLDVRTALDGTPMRRYWIE